jgi:hypothetical protein
LGYLYRKGKIERPILNFVCTSVFSKESRGENNVTVLGARKSLLFLTDVNQDTPSRPHQKHTNYRGRYWGWEWGGLLAPLFPVKYCRCRSGLEQDGVVAQRLGHERISFSRTWRGANTKRVSTRHSSDVMNRSVLKWGFRWLERNLLSEFNFGSVNAVLTSTLHGSWNRDVWIVSKYGLWYIKLCCEI